MESVVQSPEGNPHVLLLSCGTGEGHNRAAKAIGEVLTDRGIPWAMENPLSLDGRKEGERVGSAYVRMIQKVPGAFNALYKAGDKLSSPDRLSPVYYANARHAKELAAYIEESGFTHVICTHLFAMEMMTALRREKICNLPCYGVLTDYTCIPFTEETRLDGYFIPHKALMGEMKSKGFPEDRIFPTGIPVLEKFAHPTEKAVARRELCLPVESTVILLMGGSAGCGKLEDLCRELLEQPGEKVVCALTGRNEKERETLARRFAGESSLHLVPYTEKVGLYMAAADVMVTKPGGLTSTEAAVMGLPLVHLLVYSACEERNMDFFTSRGMSLKAETPKEAAQAADYLAHDKALAEEMVMAQRENSNPRAGEEIVERVIGS